MAKTIHGLHLTFGCIVRTGNNGIAEPLSLGEPAAVPNTEPSSYFDVATAQDGRSAVAYNSGQASGGAGQIYLQRYDAWVSSLATELTFRVPDPIKDRSMRNGWSQI